MTNTKRYEWKDIIAILDPNRQVAISVNNHGQIDLTRRLERIKTEYRSVWSKTYIKKSMDFEGTPEETDKLEQDNKFHLAISEHELNVLQSLARKKLHYCSLPFQINQKFHSTFTHTVESVDAGLSLDYWHYMENFLPANPFSDPVAFLRLTKGILQALSEFHHADFIHLDLNWGNVCMPSLETTFSDDLSSVTLTPNWNSIKLIDFAYSVSPDNSPKVCFKHGYTSRFENVKNEIAKYVIAEYTKRKNGNTPSWEVALHDPDWWGVQSRRKELRKFSDNLDWREDIHALGEMLTEVTYISKHARNNVNELVESLPTLLMTQGLSDSVPSNLPHEDWIKQIDKVLDLCPDDMQATEVFHLVNKRSPDTKTFRYKSETQYAPPKRQPPWPQHAFTYLASVVTSLNQVARSVPSALRKKPHLSLLAVASVVFVVLAIAMDRMGKDPIGLPLGGTAALVMLIVLGLLIWKYTGALMRGAARQFMGVRNQFRRLSYGLSVRCRRGWHSAIALWDELLDFIETTWDNFYDNHPFIGSMVFYIGTIASFFGFLFGFSFLVVGGSFLLDSYILRGYHSIKELVETSLILAVIGTSAVVAWLYCVPPLKRGAARLIMAIKNLSRRLSGNLRAYFRSRKIYPILLPIFLVPLAWTAENRYDLIAQANKTYEAWHQARDYAEASQKIKLGGWWKGERAADAQESAWLKTTRQLSEFGWPQAMFMTALTRCYGMQDGGQVVLPNESNLADCGPLLDAALQQGAQRWHVLSNSSGWSAMLEDTVDVLDSTLYYTTPPAGSFIRFVQALIPGLEAAASYSDYLAYTLADIQACWLKPSQHNSAVHTLQALIERFPDSELAKRAGEHLPGLELFCKPL